MCAVESGPRSRPARAPRVGRPRRHGECCQSCRWHASRYRKCQPAGAPRFSARPRGPSRRPHLPRTWMRSPRTFLRRSGRAPRDRAKPERGLLHVGLVSEHASADPVGCVVPDADRRRQSTAVQRLGNGDSRSVLSVHVGDSHSKLLLCVVHNECTLSKDAADGAEVSCAD